MENWPKITEDTDISVIKEIHQRIWDYILHYGRKPDTPYIFNCVLCEYIRQKTGSPLCEFCPAKWPDNLGCLDRESLFYKWNHEPDVEKAIKLAKLIRDIPFKEEYNA